MSGAKSPDRKSQASGSLPPCPVIRTPRLTLRPHLLSDAEAVTASLTDFGVARMLLRVPQPYHLGDAREWLETEANAGTAWNAAITETDDAHIGVVSIEKLRNGWHLGYWLNRQAWGRGIMSEAAWALVAAFFRQRPDSTVLSGVFADNTASLKVQAKLGFAISGIADVYVPARGATVNRIETRLTRDAFAPATE
ncbi:GNAT family N-acetyltransferase [Rhizobiaceae bacterium CRRU44]|uniref:GNAT family N-acetyltransferase n=1 Tax=Ferranicluibacter rubi TaxID=2715133 RepID=A0AA44CAQ7_9HYPH|nr:GNAT family N-acetyltransferase [Ferranicluibacter rubi]NHT76188.1 GNAT family N-acetyltransferase [Ferranicluibacter rubi]